MLLVHMQLVFTHLWLCRAMWAVITAKGQALELAGWSLAAQPSAVLQQADHLQQRGQTS
jgi:hypothetical protein